MAIEFRCGRCGRLLQTGDETAGRMAQCPECGSQTPIPFPADETSATPADVEIIEPIDPGSSPFRTDSTDSQANEIPYRSPVHNQRMPLEHDPYRTQAISSFVLGILGLVFSVFCCICAPLGFSISLAGLIFGIFGLRSNTRITYAVAGIVLSSIGVAICILVFLAFGIHPQRINIP
jgi:hypothetical protein